MPKSLTFIKKHLYLIALAVVTIVLFFVALYYPETRYHILVEAWGVFAAGIVVYFILAWFGESLNGSSCAIIGIILRPAGEKINELIEQLASGKTKEIRISAAKRIYELLEEINEEQTAESHEIIDNLNYFGLDFLIDKFISYIECYENLITNLTALLTASYHFKRILISVVPGFRNPPLRGNNKVVIILIIRSALPLCIACSETLEKAGVL